MTKNEERLNIGILTAATLKEEGKKVFSTKEFQILFREFENIKYDNYQPFPIGTVYGDVEAILGRLETRGIVVPHDDEGFFKCLIE